MPSAEERRQAYAAKTNAELKALRERGLRFAGHAYAPVLLVKGKLSVSEQRGDEPFAGVDGDALRAALLRLGYEPQDWCALLTTDEQARPLNAVDVREAVLALDPQTIVVCDVEAAGVLQAAFSNELAQKSELAQAMLDPGCLTTVLGMRLLCLGGFADALADDQKKQHMWALLKRIGPLGEPY